MGAIAGIFHPGTPKPVDPARIGAMIAAQAHRGADGDGVWTGPGIGLGQRRLAIVDRAGSAQPMRDGELALVVDGAIDNAAALRRDLAARGVAFRTEGDAELLVHAWRAWGPAMLDRLDGSFAFALHDAEAGLVMLARDRLGVKPLHHVELSDGSIAFSSELKGLLAHPQLRRVPDPTAIEDFLAYGYVPDDACIVAGVRKLAAGHFMLVRRGQGAARPQRYWDVGFADRARGSAATLGHALIARMRAAVVGQMRADVPVGALLSGDIASAGIVALMAENSKQAVRTVTLGSDAQADAVARRFATDHHQRVAAAETVAPIGSFDEPFVVSPDMASGQAFALARESMTVMLTAAGADAVFAGHRRHASHANVQRVRGLISVFGVAGNAGNEEYARPLAMTPAALRLDLFTPMFRHALQGHQAEDRYVAAMAGAPARDALDRAQYADLKIALPGRVLTGLDRMGMAIGIEARAPWLDHRLVEFAATLPGSMRIRRGQGKWLMKRSLRHHLPGDMPDRPAVAPDPGDDSGNAAALSRSRLLADTGWFDMAVIQRLADDHGAHRATLRQLLVLEDSVRRLFG